MIFDFRFYGTRMTRIGRIGADNKSLTKKNLRKSAYYLRKSARKRSMVAWWHGGMEAWKREVLIMANSPYYFNRSAFSGDNFGLFSF